MTYKEFQFLILLCKIGLVYTFNVLKICDNCGSQYSNIETAIIDTNDFNFFAL